MHSYLKKHCSDFLFNKFYRKKTWFPSSIKNITVEREREKKNYDWVLRPSDTQHIVSEKFCQVYFSLTMDFFHQGIFKERRKTDMNSKTKNFPVFLNKVAFNDIKMFL